MPAVQQVCSSVAGVVSACQRDTRDSGGSNAAIHQREEQ